MCKEPLVSLATDESQLSVYSNVPKLEFDEAKTDSLILSPTYAVVEPCTDTLQLAALKTSTPIKNVKRSTKTPNIFFFILFLLLIYICIT